MFLDTSLNACLHLENLHIKGIGESTVTRRQVELLPNQKTKKQTQQRRIQQVLMSASPQKHRRVEHLLLLRSSPLLQMHQNHGL
ncbi:hypothetical protein AV530_000251 [Patagioenas fasciata monilis]|uniref:Uncharacterized protein n=1 Tax=Patagioenas fasciata monilis TaxID=372326 RepID=A0A1V4L0W9_PATFA|nr:hypothetical protein AV530_000251 [Patagioenas fasciata monilis]